MEVILLERVEKLGHMGDVVKVKPGFARNFLLPRNKALRATEENKKRFDTERAQIEADNLKRKSEAEAVAKKMTGASVTLIRQAGDAGQLYGSVNARDIAGALTDGGFTVGRSQVALADPIKTLGLFSIKVVLHPEVSEIVTVNVARSEDEAKIQAETGKAVLSAAEEEAAAAAHAPEIEEVFEESVAEEAAEHIHEAEAEETGETAEESEA